MSRPPPQIATARLLVRPLIAADEAEFVRVQVASADLHRPWMPARAADWSPQRQFDDELTRSWSGDADPSEVRLVGLLPDGTHVAYVSLSQIVRRAFQNCIIGWRANAQLTGMGYCTETVAAALDHAFGPPPGGLALHRVQAAIIPANTASLRVAAKCGFRTEGLALRYLQIDGIWQDHLLLAKLADEHNR